MQARSLREPSINRLASAICSLFLCFASGPAWATQHETKVDAPPDAVSEAERQAYAAILWDGIVNGRCSNVPLAFQNPQFVGRNAEILGPALRLFREIYADRLCLSFDNPNYYPIESLIADDPDVRARFIEYTTTGVLQTTLLRDGEVALLKHYELVLEAAVAVDDCEPSMIDSSIDVLDGNDLSVASLALIVKKCPPIGSGPGPSPLDVIPDELRKPVDDFPLWRHPMPEYPDGTFPWSKPGFDCDDWGDTLAEYLRRHLRDPFPDLELKQLWVHWYGDGHVVTLVKIDGKWYAVDAASGSMHGPYDSADDAAGGAWKILHEEYGIRQWQEDWGGSETLQDPGERPLFEVNPWYFDPDMREKFRHDTGLDPNDYIPPEYWEQHPDDHP